jgi:Short C-terminal domain
MEDSLMEATGINGKVLLFKNVVRIKRIGIGSFLSGTSRIEKDILISQIASIQFKKAGLLNNGYIEFILLHNHERHDKNSEYEIYDSIVTFRPGQLRAFEAFREALEAKLTGGLNKGPSVATTDLDELDKLASLRDRGVITEDEFSRKKKHLLGL